jgi:hypothetical protein
LSGKFVNSIPADQRPHITTYISLIFNTYISTTIANLLVFNNANTSNMRSAYVAAFAASSSWSTDLWEECARSMGTGRAVEAFYRGNDTTITSLKNRAPADPVSSSLIKLPSPQRLNRTSVLAVARRVVENWTFLEPVEVLSDDDDPELNGTGRDEAGGDRGADAHSVSAASDPDNYKDETSADEDSSDDGYLWDLIENQEIQPHGIQPRRRFTIKEYDQALESGGIYDTSNRSRNPVKKRSEEKSPDGVLFEKNFC